VGKIVGFLANAALVLGVLLSLVARAQLESDQHAATDQGNDGSRSPSLELEKLLDDLDLDLPPGLQPTPSSPDH
jgi:hypothetical protein